MKSAVRSPAFMRNRLASRNGFVSEAFASKTGLQTDFLMSSACRVATFRNKENRQDLQD